MAQLEPRGSEEGSFWNHSFVHSFQHSQNERPENMAAAASAILRRAAGSAVRGGTAGAIAMVLQVVLLMWLRTVINYQYKHAGVSITQTFSILYQEGGIARFYQGALYALLQGPLSRFGDTAANEGLRDYLQDSGLSVGLITLAGSVTAAVWRMLLTPLDTVKTTLQVSGASGMNQLQAKVAHHGLFVLYDGALGNWGANVVGHYPWFVVNNSLERMIPSSQRYKVSRRAFIGCCSAIVSDCCSNGVRVLKTYKQTSSSSLTYLDAFRELVAESGLFGFMTRGLGVKLFSNVLSSILFSVLWKMIMEKLRERSRPKLSEKKT